MEDRLCLECGEKINGRVDKKFCTDQCRNTYNNRSNQSVNTYVRNVNQKLRKNRRILDGMNPNGKSKTTKEKLLAKGFDFQFFTNTYQTKDGRIYYYCYDNGYLELDNDWYALVKKLDWMD